MRLDSCLGPGTRNYGGREADEAFWYLAWRLFPGVQNNIYYMVKLDFACVIGLMHAYKMSEFQLVEKRSTILFPDLTLITLINILVVLLANISFVMIEIMKKYIL